MQIVKIKITKEDVLNSKAFSLSNPNHIDWIKTPHYIKCVSGWLTVCKYKGLNTMLRHDYLSIFERELIKELHKEYND